MSLINFQGRQNSFYSSAMVIKMWYEIIPSFMIITLAMAAPHYIAGPLNWLVTGHWYRRSMLNSHEMFQYLRDSRLKHPYAVLGLENIPDEEEEEKEKDQEKEEEKEQATQEPESSNK